MFAFAPIHHTANSLLLLQVLEFERECEREKSWRERVRVACMLAFTPIHHTADVLLLLLSSAQSLKEGERSRREGMSRHWSSAPI